MGNIMIKGEISKNAESIKFECNKEDFVYILNFYGKEKIKIKSIVVEAKKQNGLPSTEEIKKFIEEQENFKYSISLISKHFLGKILSANGNDDLYYTLHAKIRRAHKQIEKKYNGKFKAEKIIMPKKENGEANKPYKEFIFVKNSTGA